MISLPAKESDCRYSNWPETCEEPSDEGHWWVLRTRSRQEKAVAAALSAMGCRYFLPIVSGERFHGVRKVSVQMPLFPGYVFLHGLRDNVFQADRTGRIAEFLQVDDQQQLHRELYNLRLALQVDAVFDPYPYLAHGTWAEVKGGPYKGIQGKIDRKRDPNKLILQVDLLQSAMALELDGAMLSLI